MVGLLQPTEHLGAIQASWDRCLRNPHLDPERGTSILRLMDSEIRPRQCQLMEAFADVRAEVDALAEIALKANHCLVVTDPDSIVMEIFSQPSVEAVLAKAGITLGSCWSEKLAGTNGVSIALAQDKAFTARGADHYLRNLRTFACTGVPLHSAEGRIMGTLTLSAVDRKHPGDYVLAQHLLTQTANRIEARLFSRAYAEHNILAPGLDAPQGALVALDEDARIIAGTRAAKDMVSQGISLTGRPFEEVFDRPVPVRRLPQRVVSLNFKTGRLPRAISRLIGSDRLAHAAAARAVHLLTLGQPVAILGAAGTGKREIAESLLGSSVKSVVRLEGTALAANPNAEVAVARWIERTEPLLGEDRRSGLLLDRVEVLQQDALIPLLAWLSYLDRSGHLRGKNSKAAIITTLEVSKLPTAFQPLFASQDVRIPALRERSDRIDLIDKLAQRLSSRKPTIPRNVLAALDAYDWPGNLRELEAVLTQMLTLAEGTELSVGLLPERIRESLADEPNARHSLQAALSATSWNVSRAARLLGISRATINRRIREAGLSRPEVRTD